VTILRPVVFGLFMMVTTFALSPNPAIKTPVHAVGITFLTAFLTIMSGLAKPNYLIALIPALGLWTAFRLLTRKPSAWLLALFGVAIPGLLFLAWQYYFTYLNPRVETDWIMATLSGAPTSAYGCCTLRRHGWRYGYG
jgi:hypothetical protein